MKGLQQEFQCQQQPLKVSPTDMPQHLDAPPRGTQLLLTLFAVLFLGATNSSHPVLGHKDHSQAQALPARDLWASQVMPEMTFILKHCSIAHITRAMPHCQPLGIVQHTQHRLGLRPRAQNQGSPQLLRAPAAQEVVENM